MVTNADSLSVPIATRGGFVTILCPYTPGTTTCGNPNGKPPTGNPYLSDLPYLSSNAWGPVEKDRSNGEVPVGDGNAPTIAGTTYTKGLGVPADSTISENLGGPPWASTTR